jgi:hypothetical protein
MKKLLLYTLLLLWIGTGVTGCYKDVIYPEAAVDPDGPPQAVSYKNDIAPIFNSSCATAGCHAPGAHKPYLPTDISYNQIVGGGFVNLTVPKESILYKEINGGMREYIPSAADRQKVYDWIRTGALNN